eukprot:TRINITY_DN616_c0_g1_i2.p1 TRINITY_DN616_c0_g1~~TRINITY_DN616_c0_g1_i2.p1  ORF type:complete len:317 (+),score=37.68 TRINITY_DN616_c0_g1_i2:59-952(+)
MDALRAIYDKYCAGANTHDENMYVLTVKANKVPVDFVGGDKIASKQADLQRLRNINIAGMGVSRAGEPGQLASVVPNVTQLDIQRSELVGFDQLVAITGQLPRLTSLDASLNKLGPVGVPSLTEAAKSLRILVLNCAAVAWNDLMQGCASLPHLQELHAGGNDFESLSECAALSTVKHVDLSDNKFASWDALQPLSQWPLLETLVVGGNPMKEITYRGGYPSLSILLLARTEINSWKSIDALNQFPKLSELKLKPTPLTEGVSASDARLITISRVAGLKFLNGGKVCSPLFLSSATP